MCMYIRATVISLMSSDIAFHDVGKYNTVSATFNNRWEIQMMTLVEYCTNSHVLVPEGQSSFSVSVVCLHAIRRSIVDIIICAFNIKIIFPISLQCW